MKLKTVGLLVLSGGLILVFYAMFFFSTSYDGDVVNLHLQQQQLMLVLLGSLGTLIGTGTLLAAKLSGRDDLLVANRAVRTGKSMANRRFAYALTFPGLYLVARFFFPEESIAGALTGEYETPAWHLFVGMALIVVPWLLNRTKGETLDSSGGDADPSSSVPSSDNRRRVKPHVIAAAAMLVAAFWVKANGYILFVLGLIYLIVGPVVIWLVNRKSED